MAVAVPVAWPLSLQNCHSFWEIGGFSDCVWFTLFWAVFVPPKHVVATFGLNKELLEAFTNPVMDFPILNGRWIHC